MRSNNVLRIGLATIAVALLSTAAFAQKVEIHPYAGGFFPAEWADSASFKNEGLYGVRGGVFLTNNIEVEGNLGYINHFEFESTATKSRAWLWDANGSYNFFSPRLKKITPFVTGGVGAVTAVIDDFDQAILPVGNTDRSITLKDSDTFFALNYGGGIKAIRLWGPLGLRADVRGRTLPNFFGRNNTWLETTGGILLSWGER